MLMFTNAFRVEVYLQPGVDAPWRPVSNSGNHRPVTYIIHYENMYGAQYDICIQDVGI